MLYIWSNFLSAIVLLNVYGRSSDHILNDKEVSILCKYYNILGLLNCQDIILRRLVIMVLRHESSTGIFILMCTVSLARYGENYKINKF